MRHLVIKLCKAARAVLDSRLGPSVIVAMVVCGLEFSHDDMTERQWKQVRDKRLMLRTKLASILPAVFEGRGYAESNIGGLCEKGLSALP